MTCCWYFFWNAVEAHNRTAGYKYIAESIQRAIDPSEPGSKFGKQVYFLQSSYFFASSFFLSFCLFLLNFDERKTRQTAACSWSRRAEQDSAPTLATGSSYCSNWAGAATCSARGVGRGEATSKERKREAAEAVGRRAHEKGEGRRRRGACWHGRSEKETTHEVQGLGTTGHC